MRNEGDGGRVYIEVKKGEKGLKNLIGLEVKRGLWRLFYLLMRPRSL